MGDHGGSAVDVAKGLPQQHCQFAVPAGRIHVKVISKRHGNANKTADFIPGGVVLNPLS